MDSDEKKPAFNNDLLLQPSMLTTEPTVVGGAGGTVGGTSAENILNEEGSLFDKKLIDINTA